MKKYLLAVWAAAIVLNGTGYGDEGMWLFSDPPRAALKDKYQFEPTASWLEHLQKASVRFNNGGSGSFVSADGLVMTNHHVASEVIQQLSTKEQDYMVQGFLAKTRSEELKAPNLELNVLMSTEDVTDRVKAAVKPALGAADSEKARRAAMNTIEKESLDKTGMRSDVVTLYNGGRYHLYRYKKYTDVRLVFAPEKAIAFFGGDPDNFEFPRYDLDVTFFRVYENDRPARIEHYLKWSDHGAREGDLIFVAGHPGKTNRLDTVRHLEFLRDMLNPISLDVLRRREVLLKTFGDKSMENARRAEDDLFGYQNSRKARLGMLAGLQDPSVMDTKVKEQQDLQRAVGRDPKLEKAYGSAWERVAQSIQVLDRIYKEHYLLERGQAFNSKLFDIARSLVRLAEESAKPNAERLREYSEAGLDSLKENLFSTAPIYKDLETAMLADSLGMLMEWMGADNELVRKVLAGKSPQERAADLIQKTTLESVETRKTLSSGGTAAVQGSTDPLIQLASLVDPASRKVRLLYEEKVQEPQHQAYADIANARFAVHGTNIYPDATFTLRLAFGEVKGYTERGERVPALTALGGAFKHAEAHQSHPPFQLPASWIQAKSRLKPDTPFNFVSTADVIGGNSGSPVVNRSGEIVGIIFDGNIYSLVLDMIYTDEQSRAVAVHSAGIMEALRSVYRAESLASELTRK